MESRRRTRPSDAALASFVRRVWEHYHDAGARSAVASDRRPVRRPRLGGHAPADAGDRASSPSTPSSSRRFPPSRRWPTAPLDELLRVWRGLGYNRRAPQPQAGRRDDRRGARRPGAGHARGPHRRFPASVTPPPLRSSRSRSTSASRSSRRTSAASTCTSSSAMPRTCRTPRSCRSWRRRSTAEDAREWFWALMDYGTHLKATLPNPSRRSRHHVRQGRFEGSNRQLRGRLLVALAEDAGRAAGSASGSPPTCSPRSSASTRNASRSRSRRFSPRGSSSPRTAAGASAERRWRVRRRARGCAPSRPRAGRGSRRCAPRRRSPPGARASRPAGTPS